MAGNGGARPGAGRKKGSPNKKTAVAIEIKQAAVARFEQFAKKQGNFLTLAEVAKMSPIDVMQHAMLLAAMEQRWAEAALLAKEIAPYQFAKLTSTKVDATVRRRKIDELSDEELISLAGDG